MTKLPAHINRKQLALFAKMVAAGVSADEIMNTLSLSEVEFDFIRYEPRMELRIKEIQQVAQEQKIDTVTTWDELEALAVSDLVSRVQSGDGLEVRDVLAIASQANKADRKQKPATNQPPKFFDGGVARIVETAEEKEAVYERLTLREKTILEGADAHISSVVNVEAVDAFMQNSNKVLEDKE